MADRRFLRIKQRQRSEWCKPEEYLPDRKGGSKGNAKGVKPGGSGTKTKRKYYNSMPHPWPEITDDDEDHLFIGDDVYVMSDEVRKDNPYEIEGDVECEKCGKESTETNFLVECDDCLAGYHLKCLKLKEVPEGEWLCPQCSVGIRRDSAGRKSRAPKTAQEMFMAGKLWMARIEQIFVELDPNNPKSETEYYFTARWFERPEDTHVGRQRHHGSREVFLCAHTDKTPFTAILRQARVLDPCEYELATNGDDVYVFEYCYDRFWQRFLKKTEREEFGWYGQDDDGGMAGGAAGAGADSDDDDFFDEASDDDDYGEGKKGRKRASRKGKGKGAKRARLPGGGGVKNVQGGKEWFEAVGSQANVEGLGAYDIAAARKRGDDTPLARARQGLTLSARPKTMPCREAERSDIMTYIEDYIRAGSHGKSLYISGVPGTGKTATVHEVVRQLREKTKAGELPKFQYVEINGLRLASPQHAYSRLHEAFTGEKLAPKAAAEALEARFSGGRRGAREHGTTVLLVDELDVLVTRKQEVLYNLFEWPMRAGARLLVVGIANTMDLPDRLLPKINSRLGFKRVPFLPYNIEQLKSILKARMEEHLDAVDNQAIQFSAAKVASVSGDVRRTLELLRRAVEIAERRIARAEADKENGGKSGASKGGGGKGGGKDSKKVGMADVSKAVEEMFKSGHMQAMKAMSVYEKITITALAAQVRLTGTTETTAERVHERARKMCMIHSHPAPSLSEVVSAASSMGATRTILCDAGRGHRLMKMSLNVPLDDVEFAFRKDEVDVPWLKEHMAGGAPTASPARPETARGG